MAKIEDRIRDYAPDGKPVATGVLAVGDSWSCTNPSLGRGASIGLMHAVMLRDFLQDQKDLDPWSLTSAWYEQTRTEMEPWYRSTLSYDRARLAEVDAIIAGEKYRSGNSEWTLVRTLEGLSMQDPEFLRAGIDHAMLLRSSDQVADDPAVKAALEANRDTGGGADDQPPLGPSREELLTALS